jgi:glycosyltransferase involved in cell wall biosynthesis
MNEYLLVQTAIADYRQSVMDILVDRLNEKFVALAGRDYFYQSTKTNVSLGRNLILVNNFFFFKRRILFQFGAFVRAILAKSVILEFNPRIITNWLIVVVRKIFGKKTVFWGHAWGRLGKDSSTATLRRLFRSLSDVLVVYTEKQKNELVAEGLYKGEIVVAPNSLYRSDTMVSVGRGQERVCFLYVGRLVADKYPDRLIKAFHYFSSINLDAKLIIVGSGPLENELRSLASNGVGRDRIEFTGHISDPIQLKKIYSKSFFSVSPGYVGLSITQSFGFGVPMIISSDEPHAPEIEAARINFNCIFFESGSPEDLSRKMLNVWMDRDLWLNRHQDISDGCRNEYSAELMAERLVDAFVMGES